MVKMGAESAKPNKSINKKKRRKAKSKPSIDHVIAADSTPVIKTSVRVGPRELKLARALTDTERNVRESAVDVLSKWLQENCREIEIIELKKLWKALFYSVWMAEPRHTFGIIEKIVGLDGGFVGWGWVLEGFHCIVGEWTGIDCHRVDKFYQLINELLRRATILAGTEETAKGAEKLVSVLVEGVFSDARKKAKGVTLHIIDKWMGLVVIPIAQTAAEKEEKSIQATLFEILLNPLYQYIGKGPGSLLAVGKRVREQILDRFIEVVESEELKSCLNGKDKQEILNKAAKKVFSVAADKQTDDDLRPWLYEMRTKLKAHTLETSR